MLDFSRSCLFFWYWIEDQNPSRQMLLVSGTFLILHCFTESDFGSHSELFAQSSISLGSLPCFSKATPHKDLLLGHSALSKSQVSIWSNFVSYKFNPSHFPSSKNVNNTISPPARLHSPCSIATTSPRLPLTYWQSPRSTIASCACA